MKSLLATLVLLFGGTLAAQELTLPDAIRIGLEHNLVLQASQRGLEGADAGYYAALADFGPKVSLSGYSTLKSKAVDYAITLDTPLGTQTMVVSPDLRQNDGVRLTVSQPIFTGLRLSAGLAAGSRDQSAAVAERRLTEARTVQGIVARWTDWWRAGKNVTSTQKAQSRAETLHRDTIAKLATGLARPVDTLRTSLLVIQTGQVLLRAQDALAAARRDLSVMLGIDSLPAAQPSELGDLPDFAQGPPGERPDVTSARWKALSASARATQAAAPLWPQLGVKFNYDWSRPNQRWLPAAFRWQNSYEVQFTAAFMVFEWGTSWFNARKARSSADAAELQAEQLSRQAVSDRMTGEELYTESGIRLDAARKALALATEAARQQRLLLDQGMATLSDILSAESDVLTAETGLAEAQQGVALAGVNLWIARGAAPEGRPWSR